MFIESVMPSNHLILCHPLLLPLLFPSISVFFSESALHIRRSMCACMLSHLGRVWLFVTLYTVACQAPLSVEFFRQEYWNGLPCPLPEDLPDPKTEPTSLTSPALAAVFFTTSATWEAPGVYTVSNNKTWS